MNRHLKLAAWLTGLLTAATLQVNVAKANILDFGSQVGPASIFYEHEFSAPMSNFIDWYGFSIDPSNADVLTASSRLGPIYGITNLRTELCSGFITDSGNIVNQGCLTSGIVTDDTDGYSVLTLNEISDFKLSGGNYLIRVTGSVNGELGGYYYGVANFLGLPEPNIANLMILGLGLIGALKLRAKNLP